MAKNNNNRSHENKGQSKGQQVLRGIGSGLDVATGAYKAVKGVIDIVKLLKNHPEWYTHYNTASMVNMNLSDKQNVAYPQLTSNDISVPQSITQSYGMPAVARLVYALTKPGGDLEGWNTGIRFLYQQLRTANSGRINYLPGDLERYVLNTRLLHALYAMTHRAYEMTYTFRSTNNQFPLNFLRACSMDPDSFIKNAADLFMYVQRFAQRLKVCFPLSIDLFKRTEWLYGTIFADSDSEKPSFYVPTLPYDLQSNTSNTTEYFVSENYGSTDYSWKIADVKFPSIQSDNLIGYDEWVSVVDGVLNTMLSDALMSTIAADIVKAFGDKAYYDLVVPAIDSAVMVTYDEYILNQLQNAHDIRTIANAAGEHNYQSTTSIAFGGYEDPKQYVTCRVIALDSEEIVSLPFNRLEPRVNQYLVNWHSNSITPGEVMAITRLAACGIKEYSESSFQGIEYTVFGTEVFLGADAIIQFTNNDITPNTGWRSPVNWAIIPISGTIRMSIVDEGTYDQGQVNRSITPIALWANFDWAPRYRMMISNGVANPTRTLYSPDVLDWDVFAVVDYHKMATYFSYGDQSLLYAGPSQNQSNRKVNATGTTNHSIRTDNTGDAKK